MSFMNLLGEKNPKSNPTNNEPTDVEIGEEKIPKLDEDSLKIYKKLTQRDLRYLEFEDNLKIFSLSGNEIGEFTISVNPLIYKRTNCFKIKAKSTGTLDDIPCGTEINAIVNESLETIEQEHFEYIKFPRNQLEKKIILAQENNEYVINRIENTQTGLKRSTHKIKKSLMNGYISESANILLQRLMIQNNLFEPFSLFTFDSEINPCLVIYKFLDTRIVKIEEEAFKVNGIERTVESISDLPTTWQIYFTSDGHMANRVQIGYPAIMKTIIKPKPIEIDEYLPKINIEKKELDPEKDMQLRIVNLKNQTEKEELKNEYDQYLHNNPDLRALMADYMQSLLTFKPKDVLSFSAKHFATYSVKTHPTKILPVLRQEISIPRH